MKINQCLYIKVGWSILVVLSHSTDNLYSNLLMISNNVRVYTHNLYVIIGLKNVQTMATKEQKFHIV